MDAQERVLQASGGGGGGEMRRRRRRQNKEAAGKATRNGLSGGAFMTARLSPCVCQASRPPSRSVQQLRFEMHNKSKPKNNKLCGHAAPRCASEFNGIECGNLWEAKEPRVTNQAE